MPWKGALAHADVAACLHANRMVTDFNELGANGLALGLWVVQASQPRQHGLAVVHARDGQMQVVLEHVHHALLLLQEAAHARHQMGHRSQGREGLGPDPQQPWEGTTCLLGLRMCGIMSWSVAAHD
jgi:hypothetical protein